jgi:hypothetical protein
MTTAGNRVAIAKDLEPFLCSFCAKVKAEILYRERLHLMSDDTFDLLEDIFTPENRSNGALGEISDESQCQAKQDFPDHLSLLDIRVHKDDHIIGINTALVLVAGSVLLITPSENAFSNSLDKASIARMNKRGERESPCRMPLRASPRVPNKLP